MTPTNRPSLARFLCFAAGDFIGPALQLLLLPFYTSFLGRAELGIIATVATLHALLNRLSNLGFEWVLLAKYDTLEDEQRSKRYVGTLLSISFLVRGALVALFCGASALLQTVYPELMSAELKAGLYALLFVFLFETTHAFFHTLSKLNGHAVALSVSLIVGAIVNAAVACWGLLEGGGVAAVFFAQVVAALVQSLWILSRLCPLVSLGWSTQAVRDLKAVGIPALPQGFFTYFGKYSDQLVVGALLGQEILGLYYFSLRLSQGLGLLYNSFLSTILSKASQYCRIPERTPLLARWAMLSTSGLIVLQIPLILFSDAFCQGVSSSQFHQAYRLTALLLAAPAVSGLIVYMNAILVCLGKTYRVSQTSIVMSLAQTILVGLGALTGSELWVAGGVVLGNLLWMTLLWFQLKSSIPMSASDVKQIAFLLAIPLSLGLVVGFAPELTLWLRIALAGAALLIVGGVDWMNHAYTRDLIQRAFTTVVRFLGRPYFKPLHDFQGQSSSPPT